MNVFHCRDFELINKSVKHPSVWRWVSDDFAEIEEFSAPDVGVWIGTKIEDFAGCFWFHPETHVMWQVHTCLLPNAWGKADELGKMALDWIFENTLCRKVITLVPCDNKLAVRLARRCGFEVEGSIARSFLKNGVLLDQVLLGISGG